MGEDAEQKQTDEGRGKHAGGFPFTVGRHVVQVAVLLLFAVPVLVAGWSLLGGTVRGDNPHARPVPLPS